eukprot:sb/3463066/
MYSAKLPPMSLKGHRHFGALAEPINLLEGQAETAGKGASLDFMTIVDRELGHSTAGPKPSMANLWGGNCFRSSGWALLYELMNSWVISHGSCRFVKPTGDGEYGILITQDFKMETTSSLVVKQPYNSRTFRSSNAMSRVPNYTRRADCQERKKYAWENHRGTWGTAVYEVPVRGANYQNRSEMKQEMYSAKLPPMSLKGHRHFGALAEPINLLEGQAETAGKGASLDFMTIVDREVMGNCVQNSLDQTFNSSATQQRALNHRWQTYGAKHQPHTQACLEYATRLEAPTGRSTMESDYQQHGTAYLYQSLPVGGAETPKTPFAKATRKSLRVNLCMNKLLKSYYKQIHSTTSKEHHKSAKQKRTQTARPRSTTPTQAAKPAQPTRRSKSAMLRAVSQATSTSEVSCSLAVLPGLDKTRGDKLTSKITDVIANRHMKLKRAELTVDDNVPSVQYYEAVSSGTQTDSGQTEGLNPLWPPSNKSNHPDKIGYPHLRLPLAINTLIKKRVAEAEGNPKNLRLCSFNEAHQDDWVPRIWDYNYLLFHLNRRLVWTLPLLLDLSTSIPHVYLSISRGQSTTNKNALLFVQHIKLFLCLFSIKRNLNKTLEEYANLKTFNLKQLPR